VDFNPQINLAISEHDQELHAVDFSPQFLTVFSNIFIFYKILEVMDGLVKDLRNVATKTNSGEDYLLMNSKYVPLNIEAKNFHPIVPNNIIQKVLFVDGGNNVLFDSAAFCVSFVRVGGITYSENRRVARKLREFYLLVKENDGKYYVKTYPETSFNSMIFDPEDESLRNGMEKCSAARIVSVIRRFAEIEYAYEHSNGVDYVLMDGTLEARYPYEEKYLKKLFSSGKACALSKTCSLTTKYGLSVTKELLDLGSRNFLDIWYYYPVVTNNNPKHDAELYFIKLNTRTNYVFRFEIQKKFTKDIDELLAILAFNSCDPIFLGYPYGLIDVDQHARVSDDESRLLQTRLSVKLGKDWNEFSKHINSTNAHSILDKIKF